MKDYLPLTVFVYRSVSAKKASSINSLTDYLNVLIDILRIEIKNLILFYII